jgi:hypothetical protein
MATFFDVGSLTREELELISQRVHKKTAMLDRNYVNNKDHLMKFIESIAKKSENRDSFWNRLSRKLEQLPTTSTPNTSMPSSSGPRDTEIFAFFQGNLVKLQSLLANLIAKGSQRALIGKLTDALNITQRSSHVGNLNEAQMNLLREIHTSFNARREATALANSNNLSNYNGSSVGSSGLTAGLNNSRQRPALNQNRGPLYNQNSIPNGPTYNQNNSLGSAAYCQNNNMSKSSTFNQNSTSSAPLYNQNSTPLGSIHDQNNSSSVPLYNPNSAPVGSIHNQNSTLRGQTYIVNDVPRDQLYNQNTSIASGSMYNPSSAPSGSMQNHNNTSRGLHSSQINASEYQTNPQNGSAYIQNVHNNIPNGATYNQTNASSSTTYSRINAPSSTAYNQYAVPSGTRYIQNGLPSRLSYSQQAIHSNAPAYSHSSAPSDGMYGRSNAPIAAHNQNGALINASYDQSTAPSSTAYNQSSTPIPLLEPLAQTQVQSQIAQIQTDRLSTETAWVKDFYDKVHGLLLLVISLNAGTMSLGDPRLLGETLFAFLNSIFSPRPKSFDVFAIAYRNSLIQNQ